MQYSTARPSSDTLLREAARRMSAARTRMLLCNGFYGSLAMNLELQVDETCDTAWTDGSALGYNPGYITALTRKALEGLICHEVLHCAYAHPHRRGNRDPYLWNVACDYAINHIIVKDGMELPEGCLLDEKYKGMTPEHIYKLLKEDESEKPKPPPPPGGKKSDEDEGTDGQPGPGSDEDGTDGSGPAGKTPPPGEVRDAPEDSPSPEEWAINVDTANKMAKKAGTGTGVTEQVATEVTETKVDWRAMLSEFVSRTARDDYSWARPNRRFMSAGLYLPSMRSEQTLPIVFVRDTSASMDLEALSACTSELIAAINEVEPESFAVVDCNNRVHKVQEFDDSASIERDDIEAPYVGGGTDFAPGLEKAQEYEPACVIYFTDGMCHYPKEPDVPVLWVLSGGYSADAWRERWGYNLPPYGEVIFLEGGSA